MEVSENLVVEKGNVTAGISALQEYIKKWRETHNPPKKSLLVTEEEEKIYLQVTLKKVPYSENTNVVPVILPHGIWTDQSEVCLLTKDIDKSHTTEHEATVQHYKDLLDEQGVRNYIKEIIPLRQLLSEYKSPEAKRNLCCGFDIFLADSTILDRVSRFLGKEFFRQRKLPRRINMKDKNLKKEFEKAFSTSIFCYGFGPTAVIEIGHCHNTNDELTENVMAVCKALTQKLKGGWDNVEALHVKTAKSLAIPLYMSTTSNKDVKLHHTQKKSKPIEDELSTIHHGKVQVHPNGFVKVIPEKN